MAMARRRVLALASQLLQRRLPAPPQPWRRAPPRFLSSAAMSASGSLDRLKSPPFARPAPKNHVPSPWDRFGGQKRTMFIQTQATPNPQSLMFYPGKPVMQHCSLSPLPAYEPAFDWENERSLIFGQRVPESLPAIHSSGLKITVKVLSLSFQAGLVEPFSGTICLYNRDRREKLSEDFYFHILPSEMQDVTELAFLLI